MPITSCEGIIAAAVDSEFSQFGKKRIVEYLQQGKALVVKLLNLALQSNHQVNNHSRRSRIFRWGADPPMCVFYVKTRKLARSANEPCENDSDGQGVTGK